MGNPPFAAWHADHPEVALATFADAAARRRAGRQRHQRRRLARRARPGRRGRTWPARSLLDIANPLDFSQGFPPTLFVKDTDSLGEQIQRAFPDAKVVKTLNTHDRRADGRPDVAAGGDHTVFVSGDDAGAKATVTELLKSFGHDRRDRPRRPQHRPRHRDAAADLAAADGRAGHRRCSTSRSSADGAEDGRHDPACERWPAGRCWSPAAPAASARRPPWAWPRWAPASRSPAGTAARAEARGRARSARPAAGRSTCSSRTCPPRPRCGGWPPRCSQRLPADRRAGQQRRRLLEHPARHRRRARAHLRAQPPGAVPAHQPAARPAAGERPGPRGHGRPPTRTRMGRIDFDDLQGERSYSGAAGLQPVQARQRPVHLRAGPAAARAPASPPTRCIPAWCAPPSAPRTPARVQRLLVPLLRPFMKTPDAGRRHLDPPGVGPELEQRDRASTSPTASPSGPPSAATTRPSRRRLWDVSCRAHRHRHRTTPPPRRTTA